MTIIAAEVPRQPDSPRTEIFNQFVYIMWDEPYDNSASIDVYEIYIQNSAGMFTKDLTYCNGGDSVVIAHLRCEIPMSVLRNAPYSLPFNTVVQAKVSAHN